MPYSALSESSSSSSVSSEPSASSKTAKASSKAGSSTTATFDKAKYLRAIIPADHAADHDYQEQASEPTKTMSSANIATENSASTIGVKATFAVAVSFMVVLAAVIMT